jgi:hypothetical protein
LLKADGTHDIHKQLDLSGEPWVPELESLSNLMDYSAAVIPVTKADKTLDTFNEHYKPLNEIDKFNSEACLCIPMTLSLVALRYDGANNCDS